MKPRTSSRYRADRDLKKFIGQLVLGCAFLSHPAFAADPYVISYGGRLATPSGDAVKGPVDLEIKFYRDAAGGTNLPVSPIVKRGVVLNDGVFLVDLGELSAAEMHLVFSPSLATWVEVMDTTSRTTYPRQKLSAVPYAFKVPTDQAAITFDGDGRLTVGSIPISKVSGLDAALAQKGDSSRTFAVPDINGLASALAGKAALDATLTGDVAGTLSTTSVNKIRGYTVVTPTAANTFLNFDGTSLVWSPVSAAGVVSATSGTIGGTTAMDTSGTVAGAGNFVVKGDGTNTTELRFNDGDNSNYVGLRSPANVTTNRVWTLPADDGTSGQVLSTNGSGVLGWATNGSGIPPGTAGGIAYYATTTTLGSSAALTTNGVMLGGGAGAPTATGAGAAYQPLRVPSGGGAPVFGALDLSQSAAVTNSLPVANGGTGGTNQATGRAGLGAAASGANSDITSLTGLSTPLSVAQGGTGATSFTAKGMLYGAGSTAISATAAGTQYQVFQAGSGGVPMVGALNLAQSAATTGTLPVDRGGTGGTSFPANNLLLGSGTSAFLTVAPGVSGQVLTSDGTTWISTIPPAGPWTDAGPNIYRSSGNVGIGISVPTTKLQVAGTISSSPATTMTPSGTAQTIDLSSSNSHILHLGSATGTVTVTLSNPSAGAVYLISLVQGATPRSISWPGTVKWQDGTAAVLSGAIVFLT